MFLTSRLCVWDRFAISGTITIIRVMASDFRLRNKHSAYAGDIIEVMSDKKTGGTALSRTTADKVRALMKELLSEKLYKNNRTALGRALGISQPAVTQILAGGGVSVETAIAAARLAQLDPRELLGAELSMGVMITGKYPGLEICVAYHPGRWPEAVLAAARNGAYVSDVAASEWPIRLDVLAKMIDNARTEDSKRAKQHVVRG